MKNNFYRDKNSDYNIEMYKKIYKCRMCGKELEMEVVNKIEADSSLLQPNERVRHLCENGNMGIAEFIGYKKDYYLANH